MRNNSEHELLQAIYDEMQELKKAVRIKDERRKMIQDWCDIVDGWKE